MRSAGPSVKESVFTSRQPLQSLEYVSNSERIHSRAAPIPRPEEMEAGSCAERVERVPKLTSFSILLRIRSAETSFKAATIFGSTTAFAPVSCACPDVVLNKVIAKASTGIRAVLGNGGAVLSFNMLIQDDLRGEAVPLVQRGRRSRSREDLTIGPGELNIIRVGTDTEAFMVYCPECESDLDSEEDEVDEGEVVSCPECGTDFEIVTVNPLELKPVEEEEEDEEEDEETEDGDV